jgi:hypothetical protein
MYKIKFCDLEYGRKTMGGYTIGIESVVETKKILLLQVKETSPKGSMVTQVYLSFCVVKINSKKRLLLKNATISSGIL